MKYTYKIFIPKNKSIEISYGIHNTPFGFCLIGAIQESVCHLSFLENDSDANRERIYKLWPDAVLTLDQKNTEKIIQKIFYPPKKPTKPISLLLKGTDFQVKVWDALLKIPEGKIATYSQIALESGSARAVRAVGTACGQNQLAYVIPCHRVLTSNGEIGGYRWGIERKKAILQKEMGSIFMV